MHSATRSTFLALGAAGCLLLSLAGCTNASPEELRRRAQSFWDAKVAKDYGRSYAYLEPAWRSHLTLEQWIGLSQGVIEWSRAEVKKVTVEGSRGTAIVEYDYVLMDARVVGNKGTKAIAEPWILVDGAWYKKNVPPFKTPSAPPGWEQEGAGGAGT